MNKVIGTVMVALLALAACQVDDGSETGSETEPETTSTIGATTAAPASDTAPSSTAAELTNGQANAIRTAERYLSLTAFSRTGLIDQLEFEGFSTEDATFAVDSLTVDWPAQAVSKGQDYLDMTGFSCSGLVDQLEFEGFTAEQAAHGATGAGAC